MDSSNKYKQNSESIGEFSMDNEIRRNFCLSIFFSFFRNGENTSLNVNFKIKFTRLIFHERFNYHWQSLEKLEMRNRDKEN